MDWGNLIKQGDAGATIVFLLATCPNLQSLEIDYSGQTWHDDFIHIMSAITRTAISSDTDTMGILRKLSKINLYGNTGGDYLSADGKMLSHFMALPSLRSLIGSFIEGRNIFWPYQQAVSNITEFSVDCSDIDTQTLSGLISGAKALKIFRYDYCRDSTLNNPTLESRRITAALRQSARHSLVELSLTGRGCEGQAHAGDRVTSIGNLRPFGALTDLRLHAVMLFERGVPQRFIDFLPDSLERLEIVPARKARAITMDSMVSGLTKKNVALLFKGMAERKERLPKLQSVYVEYHGRLDEEMQAGSDEFVRLCEMCDIEMLIPDED